MRNRLAALTPALFLAACTISVSMQPDMFDIEQSQLRHLRVQRIDLINGHTAQANVPVERSPFLTVVVDQRELTDTAISILGRAFDRRGITVNGDSAKKVTLRITEARFLPDGGESARVAADAAMTVLTLGRHTPTGGATPYRRAQVSLEAEFGDGTRALLTAEDYRFSGDRAFAGAVLLASSNLLRHPKFIAYMRT
jgi:hypothetical protein